MNKKDLLKTVTFASAILAAGAISFSGVEASADTHWTRYHQQLTKLKQLRPIK